MNYLKKLLLDTGYIKPKTEKEIYHVYNTRQKAIIDQYAVEMREMNSGVELPKELFGQQVNGTKKKQKQKKLEIVNAVAGKRRIPFVPRTESWFITPEYDLLLVSRFLNSEGIFSRAMRRYVEQILRQPFKIVSQDKDNLKIVTDKIRQLETAMSGHNPGKWTFNKIVSDIAFNLVTYGNAYVHRKKNAKQSTGKRWRLYGHSDSPWVEPIAGLFVEDPIKMRHKMNNSSKITQYVSDGYVYHQRQQDRMATNRQGWGGLLWNRQYKRGADHNIVHFSPHEIDHIRSPATQNGIAIAMPMIWPVMGDIKALRMMEENVEFLVYQLSTGILHGTVGTDALPAQLGETAAFQESLDNMEGNGSIVTSHRWSLNIIGVQGQVIDMQPYLKWFLDRVTIGLGVNPSMLGLGETTNKASSGGLHVAFQGSVALFQKTLEDYMTSLFDHFLYEQGIKYWNINDQNRVKFIASEIDIDKKVLADNNITQQWINNQMSFNEMREKLGEPPIKENDGMFFKDFVTIKQMEMEQEFQMKIENKKIAKANSKAISNKVAPANKSGKKLGPKSLVGS